MVRFPWLRLRGELSGSGATHSRQGAQMGAGDRPSGPKTRFTPRKLEASRDGFPAAVQAFLLVESPGPVWTAFGAWPGVLQIGHGETVALANDTDAGHTCQGRQFRHNGFITIIDLHSKPAFAQIIRGLTGMAPAQRNRKILGSQITRLG
jgi:hypothetical protein